MKETKLYTCEYCGKQSENEQEIKDCEAKHIKEKKLSEEKKTAQDTIELVLAQYKEKYGEDYLPKFFKTRNGLNMVEKYASGCINKPSEKDITKEKCKSSTNTLINDKSNGYTYKVNNKEVNKEEFNNYLDYLRKKGLVGENHRYSLFDSFCSLFDDIYNESNGTTKRRLNKEE